VSLMPTRLLILQRLTDHLKAITIANGYDFDLGEKVWRGRIILGQEIKPLPAISIIEAPRADTNAYFSGDWKEMRREMWTIFIQGMIEDDLEHPTDLAYHLAAAVESHVARIGASDRNTGNPVYPEIFNLGGLITNIEIAPPVVRPPEQQVTSTAFFFLPVRLGVATPVGQPYTTV